MIEQLCEIHDYKIKEIFGEGSFGTVFNAKHIPMNKSYAIKVYKEPFKSPYMARQTYREIKIMRKLTAM